LAFALSNIRGLRPRLASTPKPAETGACRVNRHIYNQYNLEPVPALHALLRKRPVAMAVDGKARAVLRLADVFLDAGEPLLEVVGVAGRQVDAEDARVPPAEEH